MLSESDEKLKNAVGGELTESSIRGGEGQGRTRTGERLSSALVEPTALESWGRANISLQGAVRGPLLPSSTFSQRRGADEGCRPPPFAGLPRNLASSPLLLPFNHILPFPPSTPLPPRKKTSQPITTMVLTGTTFESSHPNGLSAGPGADVIKSIELFKVVSRSSFIPSQLSKLLPGLL